MPLYDYKCAEHGLFHELATMDESASAQPCPTCGTASGRIIMLAPELLLMSEHKRQAHSTNERSQHEPVVSNSESRDRTHGSGCACEQKGKKASQVVYLADGSKIFPSQRPWMISH